ncbi:hypothetical protein ACD575_04050 [Campylobacter sp. LH-2024]|uniref:Uncharacterized protein n=1 Tax=Campylobacter molothri TaxID=1032242 RepID=A0ACC5W352_9BACT|nr:MULTISPECIES: hypothetical protein [unclassified Campylobacter]MBZ7928904.1 hypothetical protein [Campylobacter sp. RM10542]MBZ7930367.1 hypothetical protein [Campylobacter sp. W0067]MBZ7932010.1 hypothetical protein [Campylobacter sp. RM12910]MBZ7933469.1 hypothetical protein [Campylobacter sp. RM10543]MBZ7934827.1 hypothetical protein [Campylobacter sp. W0065]MBZ7938127.1 hypothetical protein [Campylobacter sp. RM10538]MBZ7941280.1 hypothetical protein [Campylobacter sp. W0047]MBZ79426
MLKELLEIKKEMEPIIHEANVKLNVLAREVIVRRKEYEIYGPMVDRVYLDNAIYVKVMSSGRDTKSDNVPIKNGFYMVFVAPEKESTKDIKNKLKVAYEGLDNKFISSLIRSCQRFKEIVNKTQATLAKASQMNVLVKTNLGEASAALKFNITIEYTRDNQKLSRENSKSAGSFRDTKTAINLVVDKNTESRICEKLLDDVEKYFIGGGN